ncbi:2,3-dihydro-2,3-dihydroxybenzoate dehydrogenase [Amycolatopsis cihanbeyliensis]|uniref:2,3-dihydro-2,3-dihydroxybenzoate dehydrogenase n=1 Tax=Amycolatopsis cihanbeyliensis TaxID=1128664 RepID=A0A542DBG4_AMYCI|nr:2,3-dihydro-2,3-dihydroxybenzoate dehydrogenase [Amycolatopsis cihanbeyliensis]TQJ00418.1 2,3-dihydro-2,3-dihydroxybenzoate dehydrogenase [Amycolatopsis cihanbeyliensis]
MPVSPGTALVTGAARGIGAAVAEAFAREGTPVALLDRDPDVRRAAKRLTTTGARALALVADVADPAEVEAAVAHTEAELGPVTVLANVAGVLRTGGILDLDDADLAHSLAVNATGVWNTGRAAGRRMRERGAGSIVTVASNAAATPRVGMAAYSASKAAAVALTRTLGLELAPQVRCNIVCPGSTDTDMLRSMWPDPTDDRGSEAVVAGNQGEYRLGIPLRRLAEPRDVAAAVLFLASDAARHITMQSVTVDGGATLGG